MKKLFLIFIFPFMAVVLYAMNPAASWQSPDEKLAKLHLHTPGASQGIGNYIDAVKVGNLIFLSGKGPRRENGEYVTGKLGQELSIQQGYEAARLVAISQLAVLKNELGSLKKVKRIVKVNGFVNSASTFYDQPKVMDGYSDLLVEVLGIAGKHARTSVGTNALPLKMAVEVEMIVEVTDF